MFASQAIELIFISYRNLEILHGYILPKAHVLAFLGGYGLFDPPLHKYNLCVAI
jgi:hypothetical protein